MREVRHVVDGVLNHSRAVIVVVLLATLLVGAGAPMVGQSSSLDQFQTDSPEAEKLTYIDENFSSNDENLTSAQIIQRDDDVLDKASLVAMLEYQQSLRANATVNETLAGDPVSVANALAIASIRTEEGRDVQRLATEIQALNRSVTEERQAIAERNETLAATAGSLRTELTYLRENPDASIDASFEDVRANTTVDLNESNQQTFTRAAQQLRDATSEEEATAAYRLGTRGVLADEYRALEQRAEALAADGERLQSLADELETERQELENSSNPTLAEQKEQLRSMNESELNETIQLVLGGAGGNGNGNGPSALALMPTEYEPGSTEAEATMLLVRMDGQGDAASGSAGDDVTDAQLAMQDIGETSDGDEYLVFGAGIIGHEINSSMTDSILIVGPLAVLFVLVALVVAYRDLLDILLGLVGIAVVLLWTFGFMGWVGMDFNQIFVAVPVLLIGLSIDYAIHIFMRHREERTVAEGELGPRGSMRTALVGVGIALVYVTATTVIGFLSNLTSPVPPIRDFGVASSAGILAALLVFGVFMPAVKVEIDEWLEARGVNREKRAFGTGGGQFSSVLSVGAVAARKAPYLVIAAALLLSAGGAYGATQVDTSFNQADFLAEEPPDWMNELPEPFAPGEYTAKKNLEYVNDNFVREDSQAQILIEGDLTSADTLERIDAAERAAVDKQVTQRLPNGQARIESPLSVIEDVAAQNESFNESVAAADTNGDGVPDQNLVSLYDELFEVAPDRAASVIDREDGEYVAARMVIAVKGGASGDAVTEQMRSVASGLDGDGLEATATGSAILNKIVQDELLETVVNSLIITLVATFLFLMVAYRVTEGSATLGAVTLLPVAFSVTWILGTMFLLDIPFNVLTGMITSLTVGLGVAYSIHLSERYNQELTRTGDVSRSMNRAVTGTGGALLGSAATTVGGFGVLVFAILPPLQQFGKITGLTIIYAFLASVLVLPSLLLVWTRYVRDETIEDEDSTDAGAGQTPTAAGGKPIADRRLERDVVAPGEPVMVRIETRSIHDRAVLRERVAGDATVVDTTPEPVDTTVSNGGLYAAWAASDESPTLRYRTTVPEEAADGDTLEFEGDLLVDGENIRVGGDTSAEVVTDVFERVTATGTVSDADLVDAYDRFEAGVLTASQLGRVNQAWSRGKASDGGSDGE